ncbi:CIA30 family protein [Robiginitalea marina]|uniref:CIA30 family protein n=1 Tax=Robiginitalea marina TaxID=2954105 RepID=A0ABT1B1J3_9FLAO|nr:CIA30 family protein [Robiginitalea marina]MCO5725757.1 CIA30 family protein [Robiginitalea marina]
MKNSYCLFDFNNAAPLSGWTVVDDPVMGGRSRGSLTVDSEGHGVFSGEVSLKNNGGFSSIRFDCGRVPLHGARHIVLRVQGDGKRYQFRIRARKSDAHAYVAYFDTRGTWEEIRLPLEGFYPSFRGRRVDLPNFGGDSLEELGILIGNKREEHFLLRIDRIGLESD